MNKTALVYIHGLGGSPDEAGHYRDLFESCDIIPYDYKSFTPWEAKEEFVPFFKKVKEKYKKIILVAVSLGAYLALSSSIDDYVLKAFFISPLVDMEVMIRGMMSEGGVSEELLREKKTIKTDKGPELSWDYLCYAKEQKITWSAQTHILYGGCDTLVPRETVEKFAFDTGASLTVYGEGEHWFHTKDQMEFLDGWIKEKNV